MSDESDDFNGIKHTKIVENEVPKNQRKKRMSFMDVP